MSRYDLIVRGGTVVADPGPAVADIAVVDGRIVDVRQDIEGAATLELNAAGLHVFPGVIDAHVHFNEPGRTEWEGWATGSRALAAGGGTTALEMPLNANPPTTTAKAFAEKRAIAEQKSVVDFGLWGGIVPGNLVELDDLAALGVVGFKAFMSRSGTPDFQAADDQTLYEAMVSAARLGVPVAVHAESDAITATLTERAIAAGRQGVIDYLRSRPVISEVEAVGRAILLAQETGCRLHIVHVSSGRAVTMIAEARQRGVDVTCETCAHYLAFTGEDVLRLGAVAKCAPPIRSDAERNALWTFVADGSVQMVTSDHSPAPAELKTGDDFFAIWGGISGCQSTLPVVLTSGWHERSLPLLTIAHVLSTRVADRFDLPAKGRIAPGFDADLAFVDLSESYTLAADDLLYRHRHSPYVGSRFQGRVVRTVLRGETIWPETDSTPRPRGRMIAPASSSGYIPLNAA